MYSSKLCSSLTRFSPSHHAASSRTPQPQKPPSDARGPQQFSPAPPPRLHQAASASRRGTHALNQVLPSAEAAATPFLLRGEATRDKPKQDAPYPSTAASCPSGPRAAQAPQASWQRVLHLLAAAPQIGPVDVSALAKDSTQVSRGLLRSPLPQAAPLHADTRVGAFATTLQPPRPI